MIHIGFFIEYMRLHFIWVGALSGLKKSVYLCILIHLKPLYSKKQSFETLKNAFIVIKTMLDLTKSRYFCHQALIREFCLWSIMTMR